MDIYCLARAISHIIDEYWFLCFVYGAQNDYPPENVKQFWGLFVQNFGY